VKDRNQHDGARVPGGWDPLAGLDALSRRRFLALMAASAALVSGASCSRADRGSIVPYTRTPGDVVPGVPLFYSSTFQEGTVAQGLSVRTREGRPIHIEPNPRPFGGQAGLRAMADLLGLYDPDRLRAPSRLGTPAAWKDAIGALEAALEDARLYDRPVLLLTGAVLSPTLRGLLYDLGFAIPGLRHAAWEPCHARTEAHALEALYGRPLAARLRVERADVLLALEADFLGVDPGSADHIRAFARRRTPSRPGEGMNRLWAVEGAMTLTGANADERWRLRPTAMARLLFTLIRLLHEAHALPLPVGLEPGALAPFGAETAPPRLGLPVSGLRRLAADLAHARGASLVVAGPSLPPEAHVACHLLNLMLGGAGRTVELEPAPAGLIDFGELRGLLEEAAAGKFAAAVFWGANPAYDFPENELWKRAVARTPATFRIGRYEDETALDCAWRLPESHWLESWGDFDLAPGCLALRQPAIAPLYGTMQGEEILMACMRRMKIPVAATYHERLKARWLLEEFPVGSPVPFEAFWNAALGAGGREKEPGAPDLPPADAGEIKRAAAAAERSPLAAGTDLELVLSPAPGVYDGRYGNNGWLQELPDPVTKATWCNPLLLSPEDADRLRLADGARVRLFAGGVEVETPVIVQAGQAPGVASLALGYGRRTGSVAAGIGVNAFGLIDSRSGTPCLVPGTRVLPTGKGDSGDLARRQTHPRMEPRHPVRSWTLAEFAAGAGSETHHPEAHATASLIPERRHPGPRWGMAVDLSACVGCSACVVACQSENNIPVVGPEQVALGRDMQWLRVDRYYQGDPRAPRVLHQPMFCQQCDNAPCEIVCPVNATTHSPDGLNQMAYNRCVGTRYCSNNCPFKVRRFNFFDYTSMKREPETLAYNPEVTVRPRGVMEKCTFCVQRIQEAKQRAKGEGRALLDGDIRPACAAACPASAIAFGDLNDARSRVSRLAASARGYRLLEDLGIGPKVAYLADLVNADPDNTDPVNAAGKGDA
jgi:molybdopterin-containing oxidoreductase family iron-sulfur binding subunit